MPNYEYQCTKCDHRFEIWQQVGEAAPVCPECGAEVKKVFHVPRVIFKGSGFYVTDLRAEKSGGKSEAGASESSSSSTTESGSSSTSDSKSGDTKSSDSKTSSESKPSGNGAASPAKS